MEYITIGVICGFVVLLCIAFGCLSNKKVIKKVDEKVDSLSNENARSALNHLGIGSDSSISYHCTLL